jgi:hypothetical protein
MVHDDVRANLPAAGTDGRIFKTTKPGWYLYRDNGTSWDAWSGWMYNQDFNADYFEWLNRKSNGSQGTLNLYDGGSLVKAPPPTIAGEAVRLRIQRVNYLAPTTPPYTVTAGFIPLLDPTNQTSCGIVFYESSTDKFIFFRLLYDDTVLTKNDLLISLDKYPGPNLSPTAYKQRSAGTLTGPMCWFRMADDGTNLTWSFSTDGKNYLVFDTHSRTDFLAGGPDLIGFAVNSNNTTATAAMDMISWEKA